MKFQLMTVCCIMLFVLYNSSNAQDSLQINVGYGLKSQGQSNKTHKQEFRIFMPSLMHSVEADGYLGCCIRSENVNLTWNVEGNSNITIHSSINNKSVINKNGNKILRKFVFMIFELANGSTVEITGNGNIVWQCGSRQGGLDLSLEECLPPEMPTYTDISTQKQEPTIENDDHSKSQIPKPDRFPSPEEMKFIIIALSALVVLFIIIILILIVCNRKLRKKEQFSKQNRCTPKRQQSYLDHVDLQKTTGVQLRGVTSTTAQTNQTEKYLSMDPLGANSINLNELHAECTESINDKERRPSYGPKFFLTGARRLSKLAKPRSSGSAKISLTDENKFSENASQSSKKVKEYNSDRGSDTIDDKDMSINLSQYSDRKKNRNTNEIVKIKHKVNIPDKGDSNKDCDITDEENLSTHSDIGHNKRRKKCKTNKESVKLFPGKKCPIIMLRSKSNPKFEETKIT